MRLLQNSQDMDTHLLQLHQHLQMKTWRSSGNSGNGKNASTEAKRQPRKGGTELTNVPVKGLQLPRIKPKLPCHHTLLSMTRMWQNSCPELPQYVYEICRHFAINLQLFGLSETKEQENHSITEEEEGCITHSWDIS